MLRLLFEKKGNAIWISHLDLMRLFQRAFKRAGFSLTHTKGFNPRPSVSIALPLSVGVSSCCELLDFELEETNVSCEEICQKLNDSLIEGVRVLSVYPDGRKLKELSLLQCAVVLEYDEGVPECATDELKSLYNRAELIVTKKSKNGTTEQDIIPMIRSCDIFQENENTIRIQAVVCCQNPNLNPAQLVAAVERYMPEYTPDFSFCTRQEIFDQNLEVFR